MREHSSHDDSDSDSDVDALLDFPREPVAARSRGNGPNGPSLAAVAEGDEAAIRDPPAALPSQQEDAHSRKPVAWSELPRKDQLVIITLARMSEPLVQTSLQSYMFYQLKWFDPSLPDATISSQAGVLHASFMAAQFLTAMLWGRVADSHRAGRKTVLLVGLLGTSVSCLGFGFSTTFWQALVFRTLGGMTNGNIGVMRTMISEIIREKKFQARAFLLLPMTFNIGVIIGPILGGILSDPAGSYPDVFGGVPFFEKFPYATPNIVSSFFLLCAAVAVWLGLEETLDSLRDGTQDLGFRLGKKLTRSVKGMFKRSDRGGDYQSLLTEDVELNGEEAVVKPPVKRYTQRLAFRRIFTRNVALTLFAQFFLNFHVGTFNSLWFVFLSTPVWDPAKSDHKPRLPFFFTGGIGLHPRSVGIAMAILGAIGITMQLFLYPRISARLGTLKSWRYFLLCFPFTYFLVPYLSVVPSTTAPPSAKTGPAIWVAIIGLLFIQVTGRTFALPSQVILVNNCSPHPSVLGTVHGISQSVSSAARTIGPMVGGVVYGFGLSNGVVGLVFWALACDAICACLASLLVKEGDGHEIWLEGDEQDEESPGTHN
ncbi:MFS transporter [Purpureocillium lilacinum]|uniref:MFS transporter n=1 Tax=Purpureocillium lilacinum TaxID=33203 RepID=A0A179GBA7_PURLI|nr:MFS transporter [Purpureocillium lilacinum]OAQ74798.1 MFS transporter [Purpureocillium lilacinum]OAQ82908.1 MFS transporter [Purpureocillium lilacinum]